jgi:hypothetical protein
VKNVEAFGLRRLFESLVQAADERRAEPCRSFHRRKANAIAGGLGVSLSRDGTADRALAIHLRRVMDSASILGRAQPRGHTLEAKMLDRRTSSDHDFRDDHDARYAAISTQLEAVQSSHFELFEAVFSELFPDAASTTDADGLLAHGFEPRSRPPVGWAEG